MSAEQKADNRAQNSVLSRIKVALLLAPPHCSFHPSKVIAIKMACNYTATNKMMLG